MMEEKGDILFGRRWGDRLLCSFAGRGSISGVSKGNAENMGVNKKE